MRVWETCRSKRSYVAGGGGGGAPVADDAGVRRRLLGLCLLRLDRSLRSTLLSPLPAPSTGIAAVPPLSAGTGALEQAGRPHPSRGDEARAEGGSGGTLWAAWWWEAVSLAARRSAALSLSFTTSACLTACTRPFPRQSVPPVVKYPDANSEKRRMRRHAKPPVPPLLIPPVQTTREFAHGASGTQGEWGRTLAALGALAAEALLSFLCTALTNFSFFFSSAAAVAQRQPTI